MVVELFLAAALTAASTEECAIVAAVARSQFQNRAGVVPLHLQAVTPAPPARGAARLGVETEERGEYFHDYFPQLPRAEADDLAAVLAAHVSAYELTCDWPGLGVAFTGSASRLTFERPVISSDRRYAIASARYSSAAMGDGGADCLLEDRAGAWVMTVCRPASGR